MKRTFVGFGFGPIQGGLFLYEAFRSGNFDRLIVAEVMPPVVEAVRRNGGCYRLNVATKSGVEVHEVRGIEIFNPLVREDAENLVSALAEACEVATALPSVDFHDRGDPSVAELMARGFRKKMADRKLPSCVVYAGENHNHSAEILEAAVLRRFPGDEGKEILSHVQFLNTVVGKMSGVVTDAEQIKNDKLCPMVEQWDRAFLLEEFNRILVSEIHLAGFRRGIEVFQEKADLLPFEEAKLYGHNATHALIGYLARRKGLMFMSDVVRHKEILTLARDAFQEESGKALIAKHRGVDALFTASGYEAYVLDLIERMMNPFLRDQVARIIRDPRRKLSWDDRLVGTMRVAMEQGIQPERYALGAAAAVEMLAAETPGATFDSLLDSLWTTEKDPAGQRSEICGLIRSAAKRLPTR